MMVREKDLSEERYLRCKKKREDRAKLKSKIKGEARKEKAIRNYAGNWSCWWTIGDINNLGHPNRLQPHEKFYLAYILRSLNITEKDMWWGQF